MPERPIHIVIIEDDEEIRQTLALIIGGTNGFFCAATYPNAELALEDLAEHTADVYLVDIELPGISGIEAVSRIKQFKPKVDCLMLSIRQDDEAVFNSIRSGASGYLLKDTPPARLLQAIEEVHRGGAPMSMQIARRVLQSFYSFHPSPLSERESEVLKLLSEGLNYRSIAGKLYLSPYTVKTHIKNIYSKLHVHTRAEAVKKAIKDKLI
ncbi:MAG: response regulator transcription factor [Saprospiraceae bacterium]